MGGWRRAGGPAYGGAVYIGEAEETIISGSTFKNNNALAGASYGVIDSSVYGDIADVGVNGVAAYGGGVAIDLLFGAIHTSVTTITDSVFERNKVRGGKGGDGEDDIGGNGGAAYGGGLALYTVIGSGGPSDTGQLNVSGSVFSENRAQGGTGGGTVSSTGTNEAAGTGGNAQGGGVYASFATQTFTDTPFLSNEAIAGDGGFAFRGLAGRGGQASGGAIHSSSQKNLTIQGTITLPNGDQEAVAANALIMGNRALGGSGGFRPYNTHTSTTNDRAGPGGDAHGGAVAVQDGSGRTFNSTDTFYHGNVAMAGNGGDGYYRPDIADYIGAAGGDGGTARGGAVYALANTNIVGSAFTQNMAAGARLDLTEGTQNLQDVAPAGGGRGGPGGDNRDGLAYDGGLGGSAYGGALYFANENLNILDSSFNANQAIGAIGGGSGPGRFTDDEEAGNGASGARGGDAFGGAIRVQTDDDVSINRTTFIGNLAIAGRGGSGGKGGSVASFGSSYLSNAGSGGAGGTGGAAGGGAVSIVGLPQFSFNNNQLADVLVENSYFYSNGAFGGDGGFAGVGGIGHEFGGRGGGGGRGGNAMGGGLHLAYADADIAASTFQENLASGGWGTDGGYGGNAVEIGAGGGNGGNAGHAYGGGVYLEADFLGTTRAGNLNVTLSTIYGNKAMAGNGGNGGFGGSGYYGSGGGSHSGGNGGRGGDAKGGGIFVNKPSSHAGTIGRVQSTTVARNYLEAGDGGFGSRGAQVRDINPSGAPRFDLITYEAAPGQNLRSGSTYHLQEGVLPALSHSYTNTANNPEMLGGGLHSVQVGPVTAEDLLSTGGLMATGVGALAAASVFGAVAGIMITTPTFTYGAGSVFAGISFMVTAPGSLFAVGGVTAGLALLAVGGVVLAKGMAGGIITGDWEGSFAAALGSPGTTYPRNFGILITGVYGNDAGDDGFTPRVNGADGSDGTWGALEGTGVNGALQLARTLVADNAAGNRDQTRTESGEITQTLPPSHILIAAYYKAYLVSEQINDAGHIQDVGGGAVQASSSASDRNFIAKVNSGFANAIKGTTNNPLDARLGDELTLEDGAITPTLKLYGLSPARAVITGVTDYPVAQNGYWYTGNTRNIGSWGSPANLTPIAGTPQNVVGYDDGSPVLVHRDSLVAGAIDPDGDPLTVINNVWFPTGAPGTWSMTTIDNEAYFRFVPNPGFVGTTTFWFKVTDGQLQSEMITATVTINEYNRAPIGTNNTINIASGGFHNFTRDDFGFTDPNQPTANQFQSVLFGESTTGGGNGYYLYYIAGFSQQPLTLFTLNGFEIPVSLLNLGYLRYVSGSNSSSHSLQFKVRDNGGTAGPGQNLDTQWRTLTINVAAPVVPQVVNAQFLFDTAHSFVFEFDVAINPASVNPNDIVIRRADDNSIVNPSVSGAVYNSAARTAAYTLASPIGDGNYIVELPAGAVTSAAGGTGNAAATQPFFFLNGDFNHDGQVNFDDLLLLAQNYGNPAANTFAQGDANYDGTVDFDDLLILAQRYGSSLLTASMPDRSSDGRFRSESLVQSVGLSKPEGSKASGRKRGVTLVSD